MDKNTLSQYGWVVICIIVLVLLIALATPFGDYVKDSVTATVESFSNKTKLTFENAGLDLPEKTYTLEEINADEHLYGIGATRPEYVVAKFNSNYSEVTIFKNGEGSDGKMGDAYNAFLTKETVIEGMKALYKSKYNVDVNLVYDDTIANPFYLVGSAVAYSQETGEELELTADMVYADNLYGFDFSVFIDRSPKKIRIKEGITNVSDYAFAFCGEVEEIILPSSIETVDYAFFYCQNLKKLIIPESATIYPSAFDRCDSLTTVTLVDENGNAVRNFTQEEIIEHNPSF